MVELPKQHLNVALNGSALGDNICRVPAIKYCLDQYQHISCDIWAPDFLVDLLRHFLLGYEERAQVVPFSQMARLMDQSLMSVAFENDYHTCMRTHLVDHAFTIMNDRLPEIQYRNYPKLRLDEIDTTEFNLSPGTYIVLTPGHTVAVRELLPQALNEIAVWCASRGYTPVWLGNKFSSSGAMHPVIANFNEQIDFSVGVDLRGKTTLLEAGKLMALAKAVVGLDNGLLHLAGCSDVPIVVGYTTVDPWARLPYRKNEKGWNCHVIEPDESLKCRFCQVKFHFLYNHDFRQCYTGTLDCVKQLTGQKFIDKLAAIL